MLQTIVETIPRNPIVDTGPLFDFLLWRFSDSFRVPSLLSQLRYLINDPYKRSVQWYFTVSKPITTSPEVIAEIHLHAERKLNRPHLGRFWKFAQEQLRELGLSEKLVELLQMDGNILSSLGPTDTALLHIAAVSTHLNKPVFTEDAQLAGKCRERQVSVLRIAEVLSIWQQHGSK